MASTREGYLAIKKETTPALAVKPTNFIHFKSGDVKYNPEVIANNPIQNNTWNAITAVQGKASASGSYEFDLDANEAVHILQAALGNRVTADISSATDASVFKHTLTHVSALPAFTLEQGKGNLTDTTNNRQNYQVDRAFGCMVDKVKIASNDGIISMSADIKAHGVLQKASIITDISAGSSVVASLDSAEGFVSGDTVNLFDNTPQNEDDTLSAVSISGKTVTIGTVATGYSASSEAKIELTPQTPSYGVPSVMNFDDVSFQFGADLTAAASADEENVENWELEYMNALTERYGSLRKSASVIAPKGRGAILKYTKYFENVVDRDRYLNLKSQACIITITNNKIVSATDTNQAKETIEIKVPSTVFTAYDMPTGTDDLYAVSCEMEVFYDATEGKAIEILVTNSKAASVFS